MFYGSLKEVKILKYFKEHYKRSDLGFIMDRGFNSYELLLELKREGIHYIVPLMKNSGFLPPSIQLSGVFEYGGKKKVCIQLALFLDRLDYTTLIHIHCIH